MFLKRKKWEERTILLCIAAVIVAAGFFYIQRKAAFLVYDDMLFYVNTLEGDLWEQGKVAASQNRFYYLYAYFLYAIPYALGSLFCMKAVSCISVLFSSVCLFWLIKKTLGNRWGVLVFILFYTYAQINNEHNPFVSYIFYHQITIGVLLLAIERLISFYKDSESITLLRQSSVLYAVPLFLYESFLFYSLFFFAVGIHFQLQRKGTWYSALKSSLWDLRYHISVSVLYLFIFFFFGMTHPVVYDGAQWNFTGMKEFIRTVTVLSSGLFPLNVFFHRIHQIVLATFMNPYYWLKALIGSYAIIYLLRTISVKIKFSSFVKWGGGLWLAILLPAIPYGLTSKFTAMVVGGGAYGYVSSYFSYFFAVIFTSLTLVFVYQNFRFKNFFLFILFGVLMLGGVCTDVVNENWTEVAQQRTSKGKALQMLITTSMFQKIPDGVEILAPDYVEGALTEVNERYVELITGKKIKMIKEPSGKEAYEIKYDAEAQSIIFYESSVETDELRSVVIGSLKKAPKSIIAETDTNDYAIIIGDGFNGGVFKQDVIAPLNITNNISMLECTKGVNLNSLQLINQEVESNSFIKAVFSEGFYEEESWGRWSRAKSSIEIINNTEKEFSISLNFAVRTGNPVPSDFIVITPDGKDFRFKLDGKSSNLTIKTEAKPGISELRLISNAPQLDSGLDTRSLYFSVTDMLMDISVD